MVPAVSGDAAGVGSASTASHTDGPGGGGATAVGGAVAGGAAVGGAVVDDGARLARRGEQNADAPTAGAHGVVSEQRAAEEAEEYVDPHVGPSDLSNLPGPFTPRQLVRIDEALSLATEETGLLFSLYVGDLATPTRAAAEKLVGHLPSVSDDGAVLVAVSPGQRVLHIVTTGGAVRRLPNRVCALAALGMRAAFVGGDLTAGAVNGLRMLADAAGQYSGSHLPALAPFHR